MMKWELTNEEIENIHVGAQSLHHRPVIGDMWKGDSEVFHAIAQEQAKKLAEWGEEPCFAPDHGFPSMHFDCYRCRQELRHQVGLE